MSEMMYRHLHQVVNKTWNFSGRLQTEKDHVMNAVLGLVGEAGEVADILKKDFYHKKADRQEQLKLELGDVCYYLMKLIDLHNFTLGEILEKNAEKLRARYPEHFSEKEGYGS